MGQLLHIPKTFIPGAYVQLYIMYQQVIFVANEGQARGTVRTGKGFCTSLAENIFFRSDPQTFK